MSAAAAPSKERADHQSAAACPTPSLDRAVTGGDQRAAEQAAAMPVGSALLTQLTHWSTLYSDALHSIFKFASLQDLTRLMSVSRRWGEAVMTTPPVAAPALIWSPAHADCLFESRVRRHLTALFELYRQVFCDPCKGGPFRLSAPQLQRASVQVPWLSDLAVTLLTTDIDMACEALPRFTKPRRLDMDLELAKEPALCNRVIEAIGGLNPATMHTLALSLPSASPISQLSFAPLAALTQLRSLCFSGRGLMHLTDPQICELRALTSVQQLTSPYNDKDETEFLVRMLQPGHALQWTTLESGRFRIEVTAPLAALLTSLPTLTSLKAELFSADAQFFTQLVQLTDLDLGSRDGGVDPATLVSVLSHCSRITRLTLERLYLASCHMEELLPAFPLLSSLTLIMLPQLDSLRCFATPALAASLTSLSLIWLRRCPPRELSHLFDLRSLQSVSSNSFALPLSKELAAAFRMPSVHFPLLQRSTVA